METLTSAREQYRRQRTLVALAIRAARRASTDLQVVAAIAFFQAEAIGLALSAAASMLAEQGIVAPAAGRVVERSLVTDTPAVRRMVVKIDTQYGMDRLVGSMVQDAGRTATTVTMGSRPAVTAHVRMLVPPSCSRCAILAGTVYRVSTGFQRHPLCDCVMIPTTLAVGTPQVLDPMQAVRDGQVTGLSKADMKALDEGADLNRLVNVRRQKAGLTVGSSVMERAGKPTPAGIMRSAQTREQAITLLKRHGYIV